MRALTPTQIVAVEITATILILVLVFMYFWVKYELRKLRIKFAENEAINLLLTNSNDELAKRNSEGSAFLNNMKQSHSDSISIINNTINNKNEIIDRKNAELMHLAMIIRNLGKKYAEIDALIRPSVDNRVLNGMKQVRINGRFGGKKRIEPPKPKRITNVSQINGKKYAIEVNDDIERDGILKLMDDVVNLNSINGKNIDLDYPYCFAIGFQTKNTLRYSVTEFYRSHGLDILPASDFIQLSES